MRPHSVTVFVAVFAVRDAGSIGGTINQAAKLITSGLANETDAALASQIAAAISQAKLPDDVPIQSFAQAFDFGGSDGLSGQLVLSAVSVLEPNQGFAQLFKQASIKHRNCQSAVTDCNCNSTLPFVYVLPVLTPFWIQQRNHRLCLYGFSRSCMQMMSTHMGAPQQASCCLVQHVQLCSSAQLVLIGN